MTKAEELINKHLDKLNANNIIGKDGNIYKGFLNAINEALTITDVVKSLPNDEQVKAWVDGLPYYGSCTTEYNEGFEDGVKWLKEQIAK